MKRNLKLFVTLVLGATMMFSCQQAEDPTMDQGAVPETRAYGDTPVVVIYVETNDTNPLNAGDYKLSNGEPFAGIVELFASNIHKRTVNGVPAPFELCYGMRGENRLCAGCFCPPWRL